MRELHFDHNGRTYRLEIDDYGDSESSDTLAVYGPDDREVSSFDSTAHTDAARIAEARREIEGL